MDNFVRQHNGWAMNSADRALFLAEERGSWTLTCAVPNEDGTYQRQYAVALSSVALTPDWQQITHDEYSMGVQRGYRLPCGCPITRRTRYHAEEGFEDVIDLGLPEDSCPAHQGFSFAPDYVLRITSVREGLRAMRERFGDITLLNTGAPYRGPALYFDHDLLRRLADAGE